MDKAEEEKNNGPSGEESDQYLWLAGAFVGGFLIIMIAIIIGIILWKYVKKQNASIDQNWAGPSPLADGNIHEEGNFMNCNILVRSMSISQRSTSPILSSEHQTAQEGNEMGGEMQNVKGEENGKTLISSMITPSVPDISTKQASPASPEAQMSTPIAENGLKEETIPPPPLDLPQFPLPPPPEEELRDNHTQPFPEMNSYQQDGIGTQEPLTLQTSDKDALHNPNNLDHLLPPPPPDI